MSTATTCTSCGLIQTLTCGGSGRKRCLRCDYRLSHPSAAGPIEATLWVLLLLGLMSVAVHDTFLGFTYAGGTHRVGLSDGPAQVIRLGQTFVGVAVLFCAVVSPGWGGLGRRHATGGLAARARWPGTAGVLRW
ncbi:MAG: hypothetical protein AAFX76_14510, partial [Planctomycetota bacterium]